MGQRSERTFLQRLVQRAHKLLRRSLSCPRGNADPSHRENRVPPTRTAQEKSQMALVRTRETGTSNTAGEAAEWGHREHRAAVPPSERPCDLETPALAVHARGMKTRPRENEHRRSLHTFTTDREEGDEWINRRRSVHAVEYYTAVKRSGILTCHNVAGP